MPAKRMHDLVSRYRIPPSYVYRILLNREYMSTSGPLEVSVCKDSLQASFHILIHLFIKRLLCR